MKNSFKDEDYDKVVELLNFIMTKAKFELNTKEAHKYIQLLQHTQGVVLPKIRDHVLEIKKVIEQKAKEDEKPKNTKKGA